MDKKVGVSVLFGFLLLVGLVVTNAIVDSSDSPSDMLRSANITLYGDAISIDNASIGGGSEIVNLTVRAGVSDSSGLNNITNITVTWDANFTFLGWISVTDVFESACTNQALGLDCSLGDSDDGGASNATIFNNVTLITDGTSTDSLSANWSCRNLSATSVNCYNDTDFSALVGNGNNTLLIRFNVTAASNIEDRSIFIVNVSNSEASIAGTNESQLTVFVDGKAPTLLELNISDGNTTWENGTFNGTVGEGYSTFLSNQSPLTVTATVLEQNPDDATVWLFFNGSNINSNVAWGELDRGFLLYPANRTEVTPTVTRGTLSGVATSYYTHAIKYEWTIPAGSVANFGDSATLNQTIAFMGLANDTLNQENTFNDTTTINAAAVPFMILLNDTLPRVFNLTLKDHKSNELKGGNADGSGDYLAEGNITITIDVKGAPKPTMDLINGSTIYLFYNTTGSLTSLQNGEIANFDEKINLTDVNITVSSSASVVDPDTVETYETSIYLNANASNDVEIYVVVGNKSEDMNQADLGLAGNYTSEVFMKFRVDGTNPGAELSTPNNRGLGLSGSSTFTQIAEESKTTGTDTQKFSGTDISTAGTYNVRCRVTDAVGNVKDTDTTNLNQFTVSISSTGGGGAGTGGGAGAAVSFDVDFTSSPQATFKASQGRVKSFSFDGITKHTITFSEVASDSVTLIIASDPITAKLNVGQSKSIDVNADGTDDMKVQLNGIDNGVADVTVTKMEEGAAKIKAQEEQAREESTGEVGEGVIPVAGRSLAWLWWTLIVIVAIVAIGYYVNKRK
ncbi:hypothetical protein HYV89_04465 [Candidatus Woesearchaeota archaeon]|nr:hypothetical protein [Candidatus Woesearchaeota archaeon]